jgi:hypothetical protein
VSSDQAFFVQSFVNVGLIPDFARIHFLPRLIGAHRAKELMFMGEREMGGVYSKRYKDSIHYSFRKLLWLLRIGVGSYCRRSW